MKLNILDLVTDEKCFDYLRQVRWAEGVYCPGCKSDSIVKNGRSSHNALVHRYECKSCGKGFNDLSATPFAQSNKPLKVWLIALYFLGLNLSNRQIAQELDMSEKTAQEMTEKLRAGIVKKSLIYDLAQKWKQMKFI